MSKHDDEVGKPIFNLKAFEEGRAEIPRVTKELPADVEQLRGILWVLVYRLGGEAKITFKEIDDAARAGAESKILVSPRNELILLRATIGASDGSKSQG